MPIRILLVDTDMLTRNDVKTRLTEQGYLVVGEAEDGRTALNLARQTRPDLVLMDIHLLDGDGIAIAQTLMQERVAPVVILTELANAPLVERAKDAGVVNYLIKPLRKREIRAAIEVTLARYQALRTLEEQIADLSEQLETRKIIERAKGLLIERGLSEPEAFRKLRKVSMDSRKSMREVAEAVLLAKDLWVYEQFSFERISQETTWAEFLDAIPKRFRRDSVRQIIRRELRELERARRAGE